MGAIHLTELTKEYRHGPRAVDDVSLEIGDGEFMVLVGPSGCGKSTLLRLIAGIEEPTAGTVHIGERDVTRLQPRKRDIAMVFQNYALYPHLSVRGNLGFGLRLRRVEKAARERLGVTTVYVTHDQVEAMTLGTRVAVLRDGVLQQCDSPQELFHRPANLFVAAFIGSPAMNLVEAEVDDDEVAFGGHRLALPTGSPLRGRRGRVILGIRPTDFEAAGPTTDPALPRIRVEVDVVEKLGSESHLIFGVDAPRISAEAVRAAQESDDDLLL